MSDANTSAIDTFIDALWLEEGLSKNTLAAYRRDLTLYADWLEGRRLVQSTEDTRHQRLLCGAPRPDACHHGQPAPDGVQALLPLGLREHRVADADPTLRLQAARQPLRVPKTLSEAQVEALAGCARRGHAVGPA
jgi:integrase/recombinase XerD